MQDTYKHSYKIGENLLNSLSVYNVGYQKCEPEYQWGPGVRDHYCIHHILSGSGYYSTGKVSCRLSEGDTFILYPGVELHAIDALVTNFHLPESTLIMLIAAFYGYDKTMAAYKVAVQEKYRFFSFGDAMLIE